MKQVTVEKLLLLALGGYWGWFISDVFRFVGTESNPSVFTTGDALNLMAFLIVNAFLLTLTVACIPE